jgi:uncharacterized protein (DUF305 family)
MLGWHVGHGCGSVSKQRPVPSSGKPANTSAAAGNPPRREPPFGLTATYLRAFAFFVLAASIILFLIVKVGDSGLALPSDNSAEAGFARDMKTHHAQAVQMALITRDRTTDETLKFLLTDMILTQQNQIGQMEGWLNVWGLPLGSDQPAMAWMGHSTSGLMPGMATDEQIAQLSTLPEREMVIQFMTLMIAHHQSAVEMANAILDRTSNDVVRHLAESIIKTQQGEINVMNEYLAEYQAMPASPDVSGTPIASPVATPAASPASGHEHSG